MPITDTTVVQTPMMPAAPSVSGLYGRDVASDILYLGLGQAPICSMIKRLIYKEGKEVSEKGLISKRTTDSIRFENFLIAPIPKKFTLASGSGTEVTSTGITLTSVNGLYVWATLLNSNNGTSFRVEAIDTNTKIVKGTTFGATTFSANPGDELHLGAPAAPHGASDWPKLSTTPENSFNMVQNFMWSCEISEQLKVLRALAKEGGEDRFPAEKKNLLRRAFQEMDVTLLLGNMSADYATKDTTTGVQTGYTGEFPTTKGFVNWCANVYPVTGGLTVDKFQKSVPDYLGSVVNDNDMLIALCGNETYGRTFFSWLQDYSHIYDPSGTNDLKEFGLKCDKFNTAGPQVRVLKSDAFNIGALKKKILILNPNMLELVTLKGFDMNTKANLQTNASLTQQDGIYMTAGAGVKDGGNSMLLINDAW